MRCIEVNPLDAIGRHEFLDVDCPNRIESDRIEIVVGQNYVVVFPSGVALGFVFFLYGLSGHGIDILGDNAVTSLLVDRMEADLLRLRGCGGHRDGACHERKLEIALPVRSCHCQVS